MQPIVFSLAADLLNFDSAAALPELAPADAPPAASFSSLLGLVQDLPDPGFDLTGQMLPDAGNELPFPGTAPDEIEVTIEQPGLESEQLIAALVLPAPAPLHGGILTSTAGPGEIGVQTALPAARRDALPSDMLPRPTPQPAERTIAAASIEAPQLDRLLQGQAQESRGSAPLQTQALAAESVSQRPAVAIPGAFGAPVTSAAAVTLATPVIPGTPLAQANRESRAPAPTSLVTDVQPDTERPATVDRPAEIRPIPGPVDMRASTPFIPDVRERMPSSAESQGTIHFQASASVTGQAAAMRQPGPELPASLLGSSIGLAVTDPNWGEQLAQRVQILASNRLQTAEIRLNPAELGPLRVQISVDDGAATVGFQAHHALTREAIEQALPRLREMLAENGLTLSQASVGEQGGQPGSRESGDGAATPALASSESAAEAPVADEAPGRGRQPDGLVDTFA